MSVYCAHCKSVIADHHKEEIPWKQVGIILIQLRCNNSKCGGVSFIQRKKGTESEEEPEEKRNYVSERPCTLCRDYKTDTRNEPCKTCLLDGRRSKWVIKEEAAP